MKIRPAGPADADGMSRVLGAVIAVSGRDRPHDPAHLRAFYVDHPDRIACSVAEDADGEIVGFQSLKLATPGNPYGVSVGWGVIGTYVLPGRDRRGIGSALFAATAAAARRAGLATIDATIDADNAAGLAYYAAMGFRVHRRRPGWVCTAYAVPA
jgi:ribosomal protein S18 acetylase RimI-like enzyme